MIILASLNFVKFIYTLWL